MKQVVVLVAASFIFLGSAIKAQSLPPVTINQYNNIGIGSTTPISPLHIIDTAEVSSSGFEIFSRKLAIKSEVAAQNLNPTAEGIQSTVSGGVVWNRGIISTVSSDALTNYGLYTTVGGDSTSYGLFAKANGFNDVKSKYGVYGFARDGSTNYGVYGKGEGNSNSYGLYGIANSYANTSTGVLGWAFGNGSNRGASLNSTGGISSTGLYAFAQDGTNFNRGIESNSISSSFAESTGVLSSATAVDGFAYGVKTSATSNTLRSYGLYAEAFGTGTDNYGIYAEASGATNNWAGYFEGNSHFSEKVTIGTMDATNPLTIKESGGQFSGGLIHSEVLGNGSGRQSIHGINLDGVAALFEGGTIGAAGHIFPTGSGSYYGVEGYVQGGSGSNTGLYGVAVGSGSNFGVYGIANGGSNNWGGYFLGRGYFSDNVGIGVANPVSKLHVDGSVQITDNGSLILDGSTSYAQIGIAGLGLSIWNFNASPISFWTHENVGSASPRLTIQNDGKVGIGTTTPQTLLHVKNIIPSVRLENDNGNYGSITFTPFDELSLFTLGAHPIKFWTGNVQRMILSENGRLGIGTTSLDNANVHISGMENNGTNSALRITSGSQYLMLDGNEIDAYGFGMYLNNNSSEDLVLVNGGGKVGIDRTPGTNKLEVNGTASKTSAGDWLANSDARLKKNIQYLESEEMLAKLLCMRGVAYEWNDQQTDSDRPLGQQYGFLAQDLQKVWPENVSEDNLGFLQTAYGTYDHLYVEGIKALYQRIESLSVKNEKLASTNEELETKVSDLEHRLIQIERLLEKNESQEVVARKAVSEN